MYATHDHIEEKRCWNCLVSVPYYQAIEINENIYICEECNEENKKGEIK